jgi:hypothetical protein
MIQVICETDPTENPVSAYRYFVSIINLSFVSATLNIRYVRNILLHFFFFVICVITCFFLQNLRYAGVEAGGGPTTQLQAAAAPRLELVRARLSVRRAMVTAGARSQKRFEVRRRRSLLGTWGKD